MQNLGKIALTGHKGMVGAAILRQLHDAGVEPVTRGRDELDLRNQAAVRSFIASERPDTLIIAAARVGGILANARFPADFLYDNLMIETNLIDSAFRNGVGRLLFLGSSCIYPRLAAQPIVESELLNGPLEPTNEAYAIAKIAGIKLCEAYNRQHSTDFRSIMPTNLYGPGDNFDPDGSHVIPGLMRRFHEAMEDGVGQVTVWGTGTPKREFLYVDDMARAALHVLTLDKAEYDAATAPTQSHLNVGTGIDIEIRALAAMIAEVTGFKGRILFDSSKPDGTPRKCLNTRAIKRLGWAPEITLRDGLHSTYRWFQANSPVLC